MVQLVRNFSISLKVTLTVLFGVLLVAEYLDGVKDISDFALPFFFILMANDAFLHLYYLSKGEKFGRWGLSSSMSSNKVHKIAFNLFIAFLLGVSFGFEFFGAGPETMDLIYKVFIILWAGVFLGFNIYNLKNSFQWTRLAVTNIAFIFFIGSLVIL